VHKPWPILWVVLLIAGAGSSPAQTQPPSTTVIAAGDILLGRKLGVDMHRSGDYSLPFQAMAPLLQQADIAFGNFEGVFCEKPPWPVSGMVFRLRPEAVASLHAGGFDVVSVANNHFGDGGEPCLTFSLAHLRQNGVATAGAGAHFAEAHTPAILERQGLRFAFLAYTYAARNDVRGAVRPVIAGRNSEQMRRDVAAARQQSDIVIVSLHDGTEYVQRVARETEEFARAAIDAGAVAVFGHHPHVPQRVEPYKDGWIFYSLGNFVFQQNTPPAVRHALLARLTFSEKQLAQVEAIPAVIEYFARPRPATPEEAARILQSIGLRDSVLWRAP
jgi:poly-gamma-glutamate synthesis protein (capsule biosynthesis protein)